jgi:hypothetical protein
MVCAFGAEGPPCGPGLEGAEGSKGCGIAAFGGDEYEVSVTEFPFAPPVLHDEVR